MNTVEFSGYKVTDTFTYKGKKYGVGTIYEVRVGDKIIQHQFIGINSRGDYVFEAMPPAQGGLSISPYNLKRMELKGQELNIVGYNPHIFDEVKPGGYVDTTIGWIWYIIAMCVSLLFKDFLTAWLGASVVFFAWRHDKIHGGKRK